MSYPKELWENTRLEQKAYPFQLFQNRAYNVTPNECFLYLHWHEHFEIIIMREGNALFHIDSRPFVVKPGEVLLIPGGGLHVGYALGYDNIYYDCIVFNASLFNDWVHDPLHAQFVAPYLEGRLRYPVKPAEQDESCLQHYSLLEEAITELIAKPPAYQLIVKSKLYALFTLLSRTFIERQLVGMPAEPYFVNRDRFKLLIQRIESDFREKMSIEQAAKQVSLNPYHFCKLFKKLTGRTFVEYVNVNRMNEAERLLRESNDTITEIAAKVGCENPNYFTKLYKQYKGITPSQARKLQ
ncbi:AraC family transcriptional regulator [Paenibacillus sp. FSL A5-0031]|uniref:helix-turn-helix transcriptional regulator n=1 Tax=unclassified Paenibacillus TaxID=185978 RepID=UPI00096EDAAB|nr:AraC family transcriptional regulator [Paenibacillus sp. FSL A5-0031]OME86639.1 AraC family transcriptional regulator [Paenibacillus sp. FSL A5-0031]